MDQQKRNEEIRLLLVEDDEGLSQLTAMRLRAQGYQVVCAMNGQQALSRLAMERIDLILLDVLLPDMDGHEICQKAREPKVGYGGPIIFMSCLGDSDNIVDAFREGGNDYIVKPVKMSVLLESIGENLEGAGGRANKRWFKQFMIDSSARSVWRVKEQVCQEKIELSRTEYDILQVFVNRPGEVILYRQLYNAVWGMEDLGDVRTLMVHVSNLRKKIDADRGDMIRAVRGVGYVFEDK